MFWINVFASRFAGARVCIEALAFWAAAAGILAVWAGLSRRHWFVRALIVVLASAVMLPVRAYEPALLSLLVTPTVAVIFALVRRWFPTALACEPTPELATRIGIRVLATVVAIWISLLCIEAFLGANGNPIPGEYPTQQLAWYEWQVFGVVSAGLVLPLAYRMLRAKPERREENYLEEPLASGRSVRFGLRDLLLSVVVVAIASATLGLILDKTQIIEWPGLLATGACLMVITALAAGVAILRRGGVILAPALVLAIAASSALHTWAMSDWIGAHSIVFIDQWTWQISLGYFLLGHCAFAVLVMALSYLFLLAGAFPSPRPIGNDGTSGRAPARVALACVCLAIYGPLAAVYCRILVEPSLPSDSPSGANAYPQIIAEMRKFERLNPSEMTVAGLRDLAHQPERSEQVAEIYRILQKTLEQPAFVPLVWVQDARNEFLQEQLVEIGSLRSLARTWDQESSALEAKQQFDEAAEFGLANIRLGSKLQFGGTVMHSLVGVAAESIGMHQINRIRQSVSADERRRLIAALQPIDRDREPRQVTIDRETTWSDRAYTWRYRLGREAPIVLASATPTETGVIQAYEQAHNRRNAVLRLLITDLAIRLFQHDHDRLPDALEELCPQYLTVPPIDPFSGQPLIYRRMDDTFVLYSVWRDGDDDGGRFGKLNDIWGASDFDLDLDSHLR